MEELLTRIWEMLVGRLGGPLHLRFVAQPCIAAFLGIRIAVRDARAGRPPYYFLPAFTDTAIRRELLGIAFKDVRKIFIAACIFDIVYTLIVFRWVYPLQTLLVALVLALIPYLLVRGPVTRIAARLMKRNKARAQHA